MGFIGVFGVYDSCFLIFLSVLEVDGGLESDFICYS